MSSIDNLLAEPSLYERLGGDPAVTATVNKMYELIPKDDLIKHFFANTDLVKQIRMQKKFLTLVFQDKELSKFAKQSMQKSHKRLHLEDAHFDRVKKIIADSMLSLGVKQALVDESMAVTEKFRSYMVVSDDLPRKPSLVAPPQTSESHSQDFAAELDQHLANLQAEKA